MSHVAPIPWRLRRGLILRPTEGAGQYVVKDPAAGAYFHIGEVEYFLLTSIDGAATADAVRTAYEQRFRQPLSNDDLHEFVDLGRKSELLEPTDEQTTPAEPRRRPPQSILSFRFRFFDPDRLFSVLAPRLSWLWTKAFFAASLLMFGLAALIFATNRHDWLSTFPDRISVQTIVMVWLVVFVVTMLHEFAHGLTCKHFGGEVHEVGFLLLLFMPCLYCNVSDAWLFREKSKRLWVGAAGAYWDLCIGAAATIVWRITVLDSFVNYLAWLVSTICFTRCFFNFNPLVRLDGYYVLSDVLGLPNLSERGSERWLGTLRWLFWGGPRPGVEPRSGILFAYGMASWLFLGTFVVGMIAALLRFRGGPLGAWGVSTSLFMLYWIGRNLFKGLSKGEFSQMLQRRKRRAAVWGVALLAMPTALFLVPYRERSTGTFQVRPTTRIEICATESGFLREIAVEEGSRVSPGTTLLRIDIPDLDLNISKKEAEVRESQANLRRLQAGPRKEEIHEQRQRITRSEAWRDRARQAVGRAEATLREDLTRLDRQVAQYEAEADFARQSLAHAEKLHNQRALSGEQYLAEKTKAKVVALQLEQAKSQKASREVVATTSAQEELAAREKDLADEQATLRLLEAGTRPEEIEAEQSRLARLQEELKYLEAMKSRVVLTSPVMGQVTTPRLKEKNGVYVEKGKPVCVIEDLTSVVAEIAVREDEELHVASGQTVELRPRAMPFRSFQTSVDRKAPSMLVTDGKPTGTVTVYCKLTESEADMLSGMTGFARIYRGHRPLGLILWDYARRYVRTEFWF